MLLFSCESCGGRIVSFENVSHDKCPNCGSKTAVKTGVTISIPMGLENFSELDLEPKENQDDLVLVSSPSWFESEAFST